MRVKLTPKEESLNNQEVYRFAHEFYEDSGNIYITNTDMISEIYESVGGVMVWYNDNSSEIVKNYEISSIEGL
jgi:hypothetical protein